MTEERKQFNERYNRLPPTVKQAIDAVETADLIQTISEAHKLHIDQMGEFSNQIGLVMLGVVKPQEFIPNLREKLKIGDEEARKIALEVNEQIFNPIRESLKQVHAMGEMAKEEEREAKAGPSDGAPKELTKKEVDAETKPVNSSQMETRPNNFDDRLGRYLSSSQNQTTSPAPRSYSHDPYHEAVE
jgi:hypothetical protein